MGASYKVAVIGAGTAGLVTARELQREGHRVTVFEKADKVGGTWLYNPRVETDPLGLDPNREKVHSSLYKSTRVNVPRQTMSFLDYPFVKKEGGDPRHFPGHEEVLRFLEDFTRDFGLMELIRFEHEVTRVELVDEASHEWVVESRTRKTESKWESEEEVFEAVVICNGKNTEPNIATFSGWDTWPRLQLHSHNYRTPQQLENKIVVIIGNSASALDILKEIAPLAKQVHQAVRGPNVELKKLENRDTVWKHPMIECAHKDGKVVFEDGSIVDADVILHCTGYKYHFPFLKSNGIVTVEDNRVGPLFQHVFPPSLAPWLSFVGLPYQAATSLVTELQSKWVAKVLSSKLELPTQEAMICSVEEFYNEMEKDGWPKHHTHNLLYKEPRHIGWLVAQMDIELPIWLKNTTVASYLKELFSYGDKFRDLWDIDKWIQEMDSPN
ncbi:flavin-containing monooxygenase FMO GS-OX5-like isoform X2 [Hibiscus syriacus]|uniref:flavin-containing monooxygenase FMO GS-OX5-like isoform X2 n=1 Tax=Hibiscus syriacus TaxID=106335 RepID=UPI0019209688|nr:flavin-containing monooxygenase FMO GS-OX5-like isoform X2 [Hibiscus syriacus]